jgi:hypothetical protein
MRAGRSRRIGVRTESGGGNPARRIGAGWRPAPIRRTSGYESMVNVTVAVVSLTYVKTACPVASA